jgi:hypothetical protein
MDWIKVVEIGVGIWVGGLGLFMLDALHEKIKYWKH